jgi:hypothetical protein
VDGVHGWVPRRRGDTQWFATFEPIKGTAGFNLPRLSAHVDVEMSGIAAVSQRYIWLGKRIATGEWQNATNNAREMSKKAKFPEQGH